MVESFKSTLDEVREADLLLHVVDISHPDFEDHIASVNQILQDIKSADKPTIMVFNKIDAFKSVYFDENDLSVEKTTKHYTLEDWKQTWMSKLGENKPCLFRQRKKLTLKNSEKRCMKRLEKFTLHDFRTTNFYIQIIKMLLKTTKKTSIEVFLF